MGSTEKGSGMFNLAGSSKREAAELTHLFSSLDPPLPDLGMIVPCRLQHADGDPDLLCRLRRPRA
jgi:hypothetical protein